MKRAVKMIKKDLNSSGKPLKILQIAPPFLPIGKYGGAEAVIENLDRYYSEKGFDCSVVCTNDSVIEGKKFSAREKGLWSDNKLNSKKDFHDYCYSAIEYIKQEKPDIVHDHLGFIRFEPFKKAKNELPPILSTIHSSADYEDKMKYKNIHKSFNGTEVSIATVSESQREIFNEITKVNYVVHTGIDHNEFSFQKEKRNYVFFMSSLYEGKGPDVAIKVARDLGKKIVIAGPVHTFDKPTREYWKNKVKPYIDFLGDSKNPEDSLEDFLSSDKKVMYMGPLGPEEKKFFYRNAEAFYAPVSIDDACPLSPLEANACGTPVVAFGRGAYPELVNHGKTGYVAKPADIEDFKNCASKVNQLSPEDCREHLVNNFSLDIQAQKYLQIYREMLENKEKTSETLLKFSLDTINKEFNRVYTR